MVNLPPFPPEIDPTTWPGWFWVPEQKDEMAIQAPRCCRSQHPCYHGAAVMCISLRRPLPSGTWWNCSGEAAVPGKSSLSRYGSLNAVLTRALNLNIRSSNLKPILKRNVGIMVVFRGRVFQVQPPHWVHCCYISPKCPKTTKCNEKMKWSSEIIQHDCHAS